MEKLTYDACVGLSLEKLNGELDAIWDSFKEDVDQLKDFTTEEKCLIAGLIKCPRNEVITIKKNGYGLDPDTIQILIIFGQVGKKILSDLWEKVFLPRIEQRYGKNALKKKADKQMK